MPTRTIFFHISALQQAFFYLLAIAAIAICFHGVWRRVRLWRTGRPIAPIRNWPTRARTLAVQALAHRRTLRRKYAGRMHLLVFYGFGVLFLGTCIVAVEHYGALLFGAHWLYRGWFYLLCKVTLDLFGLGLLVATLLALARRFLFPPRSMGNSPADTGFLLLLLAATLTGFMLEGAGIAADPQRHPYADFSPIGSLAAPIFYSTFARGPSPLYAAIWWIHIPLVLAVIAVLPYGRWLHLFVIPAAISFQPERGMGVLEPVSLAEVEESGRIGYGVLPDMDRWMLMSLDGCMECGRCTEVCPAKAVGKELDPKGVVLALRGAWASPPAPNPGGVRAGQQQPGMSVTESGQAETSAHSTTPTNTVELPQDWGWGGRSTDLVSDASLWACTNCHACVRECPALIRHVDIIDGIRRFRVAEGRLAGTGAVMLRQLGSRENPWGLPASQRLDWAKGMEVPQAALGDGREALLWVGCAGAFEPRAQKTTRALAQLLQMAGVRFSVLGSRERCTGDPARRTGDEFLFQQLAGANVETLQSVQAARIVTQCPHCFHTLKNEYPQFGGQYEVMHHTQYLAQLVAEGKLRIPHDFSDSVTYHDPCYLARVNGESAAPRSLLGLALKEPVLEPERRGERTFCCGAGGGRMWMEEPANQRPGVERARELIGTGAKAIAVGCPFCRIMVSDSAAQAAPDSTPPVLDVAEILLAAAQTETVV